MFRGYKWQGWHRGGTEECGTGGYDVKGVQSDKAHENVGSGRRRQGARATKNDNRGEKVQPGKEERKKNKSSTIFLTLNAIFQFFLKEFPSRFLRERASEKQKNEKKRGRGMGGDTIIRCRSRMRMQSMICRWRMVGV